MNKIQIRVKEIDERYSLMSFERDEEERIFVDK